MRSIQNRICLICLLFLSLSVISLAQEEGKEMEEVKKLSFEEIYSKPRLNIKVEYTEPNRISTAGRGDAQEPDLVPATVVSISEELIRIRGYQSLWDLLRDLPGIKTDQQVLPESFNRTTFRGVVGMDKFLILLDGIRISSPTNEEIPILENYPVHMAKQIEILYGPASALYGADAFAGVINIISKTADDVSAEANLSAGMYGKYVGNVMLGHRFNDKISFTLAGQYSFDEQPNLSNFYEKRFAGIDSLQSGVFNTVLGVERPESLVDPNYSIPISNYAFQGTLRFEELLGADDLKLNFFQNQSRAPSVAGMNPNNAVYNENNFMTHRVQMLNLNYQKRVNADWSINTLITASRYRLDPESGFQNVYTQMERTYRFATGRMYQIEQLVTWNPSGISNLSVVAGFTYQNFNSRPLSVDLLAPTRDYQNPSGVWFNTVVNNDFVAEANRRPEGVAATFFELNYTNIGGFIQAQYAPWADNDRLLLTLGGRIDRNSRFDLEFNPRVGLVWAPWRGKASAWNGAIFKLIFGRAFLEPSPHRTFEQFGTFSSAFNFDANLNVSSVDYRADLIHQPNAELEPQEARTFEISFQNSFNDFEISFQGYYSRLTNLISTLPDGSLTDLYDRDDLLLPNDDFYNTQITEVQVNVNQDRGASNVLGGNLRVSYSPTLSSSSELNIYASLSYIGGSIDTYFSTVQVTDTSENPFFSPVNSELPFINPWSFYAGFDLIIRDFSISPRVQFYNAQYLESFNPEDPSKRQKLNGYARVDLSAAYQMSEQVGFFLKMENLLDKRYFHPTEYGNRLRSRDGVFTPNTEFFRGSPQNPFRLTLGLRVRM